MKVFKIIFKKYYNKYIVSSKKIFYIIKNYYYDFKLIYFFLSYLDENKLKDQDNQMAEEENK